MSWIWRSFVLYLIEIWIHLYIGWKYELHNTKMYNLKQQKNYKQESRYVQTSSSTHIRTCIMRNITRILERAVSTAQLSWKCAAFWSRFEDLRNIHRKCVRLPQLNLTSGYLWRSDGPYRGGRGVRCYATLRSYVSRQEFKKWQNPLSFQGILLRRRSPEINVWVLRDKT